MSFNVLEFDVVADVVGFFEDVQDVKETLDYFSCELNDTDDAPWVYIGLGVAHINSGITVPTRLKNKVFSILSDASFAERFKDEGCYSEFLEWKQEFENQINTQTDLLNKEKKRLKAEFLQHWKKATVGDLFAYRLRNHESETEKWILYRVIDKGQEVKNLHLNVMFLPDLSIPSENDFSKLIFLPGVARYGGLEYRFNMVASRFPNDEYKIVYLGNYAEFSPIKDEQLTLCPLYYRYARHNDLEKEFEEGIRLMRKYGNGTPFWD